MKDARGDGALRRQGAEPAQPRPELLAEADDRAPARRATTRSARSIDRVADLEVTEVDSVSEALLLEANLIKRFKPRFNVRLKDDKSYPYIKVTLGDDFPRIERTRKLPNDGSRVLRAVRVGELGRRGDEPRPAAVPVPDLHDRHQGRRARAAATVPPVPHQALPGPVHRGDRQDGVPPRHRPGGAVPRGQRGRARGGPPARDGLRRRAAAVREGGGRPGQDPGHRADDGEPEDGRLRPHGAGPRRRSPARTTRPRSSCSSCATGRCSAGTCSSSTRQRDVPDDEVLEQLPPAVLRARDERPARGARAAQRSTETADLEAFLSARSAGAASASGRPSAARSGS